MKGWRGIDQDSIHSSRFLGHVLLAQCGGGQGLAVLQVPDELQVPVGLDKFQALLGEAQRVVPTPGQVALPAQQHQRVGHRGDCTRLHAFAPYPQERFAQVGEAVDVVGDVGKADDLPGVALGGQGRDLPVQGGQCLGRGGGGVGGDLGADQH
ncbi:hypothetical protein ACFUNF_22000 [Streptomyces sp. NPDC057291]|uniref:hypothetical protein n=1 Tax=Streptomyces sp. NPDC057291 TaxID=3346087 RepID=UPI00362A266D